MKTHTVNLFNIAIPISVHWVNKYFHGIVISWITSGVGTAYPSWSPEFITGFSGVRITRSLVLYVCFVDRCLSFCTISFGHRVVCSSSINRL